MGYDYSAPLSSVLDNSGSWGASKVPESLSKRIYSNP